MGKKTCRCANCSEQFIPSPRVVRQRYCSKGECQRARRARWQRQKVATDEDYRENQKRCWEEWQKRHPGYYREYRKKHPEYVERNRLLQHMRDGRRGKDRVSKILAKMDSIIKPYSSRKGGVFKLIPQDERLIAKMNSLIVKLVPVQQVRT